MKFLLFYYTPGAGGKFLINLLAYSGQVAIQHAEHACAMAAKFDLDYINQVMLATVPDVDQGRNWYAHELGCDKLFTERFLDSDGREDRSCLDRLQPVIAKDLWLPLICHSKHTFSKKLSLTADHERLKIFIDSDPEFIDLCIRKKWPEEHHCLDLDQYRQFKTDTQAILPFFDYVLDNFHAVRDDISARTKTLAQIIGIDYDFSLARQYVDKYIAFHNT